MKRTWSLQTFSPMMTPPFVTGYNSHEWCMWGPVALIYSPTHFFFQSLFNHSHLKTFVVSFHYGFNLLFTNDSCQESFQVLIGHFCIFLGDVVFQILWPFLLGCFHFLVIRVLGIFWIRACPLSDICVVSIISWAVGCPLVLLTVALRSKHFKFWLSSIFQCFYNGSCLCFKKTLLNPSRNVITLGRGFRSMHRFQCMLWNKGLLFKKIYMEI